MKSPLYINATACISPQHTMESDDFLKTDEINIDIPMRSIEPNYKSYIDRRYLRRMGRMVRMGVSAAVKTLKEAGVDNPDAILVGTGLGCLEDTVKFLQAIYESDENIASPNQFIQSTHNNVAAQIALLYGCYNYNFTYVHRGFSFESALLDAVLHAAEANDQPTNILVGACDELIDMYLEVIEKLNIWKPKNTSDKKAFGVGNGNTPGEGAAFFAVGNMQQPNSIAKLEALQMIYKPRSKEVLLAQVKQFLSIEDIDLDTIDLVLLGHDGGNNAKDDYSQVVDELFSARPQGAFKHLCGEYKTSGAFATWLAVEMIRQQHVPSFVRLNEIESSDTKRILIFNNYNSSNYVLSVISYV